MSNTAASTHNVGATSQHSYSNSHNVTYSQNFANGKQTAGHKRGNTVFIESKDQQILNAQAAHYQAY